MEEHASNKVAKPKNKVASDGVARRRLFRAGFT